MADTLSKPPRINWSIAQRDSTTAGLYAVALINTRRVITTVTDAINDSSLGDFAFREFAFKVNPSNMDLEEPAATQIVPTQNGMFVESQGQIFKNVNLSGTTGLRPNQNALGAIIPLGGFLLAADRDPDTRLPNGERTGFDDLIELRNVFRDYWDKKRDPNHAPYTLMVWQNGKEGEYYVVEPILFKTDRDAGKNKVTFDYSIQLRTLERLDVRQLAVVNDPYKNINGPEFFYQRISDTNRQLTAAYQTAQASVDLAVSSGNSTISSILTPVNNTIQSLTGIISSGRRVFAIPKNQLSTVAQSSVDLATTFDTLPNNIFAVEGVQTQQSITSNAFKNIARKLNAISQESQLFTTPVSSSIADKQAAYSNPITGLPPSGGSATDLGETRATNATAVSSVLGNETIQMAAKRLLGDSANWKVLVILNQLKAPYISPNGNGNDVLRPGQQILYPIASNAGTNTIAPTNKQYSSESAINQRFGRDVRLINTKGAAGDPVYDIAVGPTGGLDTIAGVDNLLQAITIKCQTEQGELPTHASFGLRLAIGGKVRIQSLISFQVNARATLLSDSRIGSVDRLRVFSSGNTVRITGAVTARGQDQAVNFDLGIRR